MQLVTTHNNVDFDGLAAMLAYQKLYPETIVVSPGAVEHNVAAYLAAYPQVIKLCKPSSIEPARVELLIIMDASTLTRTGQVAEKLAGRPVKVLIFDHHHPPANPGHRYHTAQLGAICTLLIEELATKQIELSAAEATLLLLGIYEDTGSLLYPTTTPRDLRAAAFLCEQGAKLELVAHFIKQDLDQKQLELKQRLQADRRELVYGNYNIAVFVAETPRYVGDLATIAEQIKSELEVVICIVTMGQRTYLVARSLRSDFSAAEIMSYFGGGGHGRAASASLPATSIDRLLERLQRALHSSTLQNLVTAADLMIRPVVSMQVGMTMAEAKNAALQIHHSSYPVLKGNKLVGMLHISDMERALLHGLGAEPIASYINRDVVVASTSDSIEVIYKLLSGSCARKIVVCTGGDRYQVVGVISHPDLLAGIYSQQLGNDKPKQYNLAGRLRGNLPHSVFNLLVDIGEHSQGLGFKAYLVGGFVRDALLNKQNLDVDIVLEGDGIAFARSYVQAKGGRLHLYAKFGTATIVFPDGFKLDIATARTEVYSSPGAMPKISYSLIKYDLFRRDFTINAMAVSLVPDSFGRLIDFFDGRLDLKRGQIKVLHNLSFIDDPTRILRAIRFEQRYNFRIDRQSIHFIDNALKLGVPQQLSAKRIFDELRLIFTEAKPNACLQRMAELGVWSCAFPDLSYNYNQNSRFEDMSKLISWYRLLYLPEQFELWLPPMMLVLQRYPYKRLASFLNQLALSRRTMANIKLIYGKARVTARALQKIAVLSNSALYRELSGHSPEYLLYVLHLATGDNLRSYISHFITHSRFAQLKISGQDLIAAGVVPGPHFRSILEQTLQLQLDGKLSSHQAELVCAMGLVKSCHLRPHPAK